MNRRQAWRARLGAWVAAALACGAAQAAEPAVALRVPAAAELPWRGLAGAEAAGAAGAILYPVPGLVGLLAAVFTHGAVVEGTRSAQRSKQQEAADQVLEPYRSALATWTPRALLDATATRLGGGAVRVLASDTEADAEEWLVEISPSFAITPDHATVLLDNTVRVTRASVPGGPRFENTVRVLSAPLVPADARGHWSAEEAKALKEETAAMVAHTVEIAMAQATTVAPAGAGADETPFRTHRYLMGSDEKMERSQLVASACNRSVLRTLRGSLLSVPVRPVADQPPCIKPYQLQR